MHFLWKVPLTLINDELLSCELHLVHDPSVKLLVRRYIGKGRYLSLCRHVQLLRYIYSGFLHPWLCLVSNAPEVRLSTSVSQDKSLRVRLPMSYDSYLDNNLLATLIQARNHSIMIRISLASHTLQPQEKEDLVTSCTTTCASGMQLLRLGNNTPQHLQARINIIATPRVFPLKTSRVRPE